MGMNPNLVPATELEDALIAKYTAGIYMKRCDEIVFIAEDEDLSRIILWCASGIDANGGDQIQAWSSQWPDEMVAAIPNRIFDGKIWARDQEVINWIIVAINELRKDRVYERFIWVK